MLARVKLAVVCVALALFTNANATDDMTESPHVPLTAECLNASAAAYKIHPDILLAILLVEGGTVGRNSKANTNGSYDIGLFQINTIHRSTLKAMDISEQELRNNGCLNAAVAAWQLRRVLPPAFEKTIQSQDEYLSAIARYHSVTPIYNKVYAGKLKTAFAYIYSKE